MRYAAIERRLPRRLHRHILHFEAAIDDAVRQLAAELPAASRVLDAGAGEAKHAPLFHGHRYTGVDLAIGEPQWNYGKLDAIADLAALPFPAGCFDACLNIVTLEHVCEPECVLREIGRVLAPGGRLLLIVPQDWEVHQAPHDYYRYTRYGVRYLLGKTGFGQIQVLPAGGYFRLLSRRLLNALQFFHGPWFVLAALLVTPPALLLPWLDRLDRDRDFTVGYICWARKRP